MRSALPLLHDWRFRGANGLSTYEAYKTIDQIAALAPREFILTGGDPLERDRCEFRYICGGSRARAWTVDGNVFAGDPLCAYEPGLPLPLPAASGSAEA